MKVVPLLQTDGAKIFVEIEEDMTVVEPVAEDGQLSGVEERIANRLDGIGELIVSLCTDMHNRVSKKIGDAKPNEWSLEFGIKLGGGVGIPVVANGSAEGALKVVAKWQTNTK